jgi:hypothetical protein
VCLNGIDGLLHLPGKDGLLDLGPHVVEIENDMLVVLFPQRVKEFNLFLKEF